MGKYAKYALVLLYVVQLIIAFHEQLTHLYKSAVDAVHRETTALEEKGRSGALGSILLPMRSRPLHELSASLPIAAVIKNAAPHHSKHDFHDQNHSRHDRPRKQKKPMRYEFLLLNLYPLIRIFAAAPNATQAREDVSTDMFMKLAHVG